MILFQIPEYDGARWISEPLNLNKEGKGDHNEHLVIFHTTPTTNRQSILVIFS